jgi:hypothetical protein
MVLMIKSSKNILLTKRNRNSGLPLDMHQFLSHENMA